LIDVPALIPDLLQLSQPMAVSMVMVFVTPNTASAKSS
jgi:hypothetical protein